MTFRIDRASTDEGVVLHVSGRIAAEDLEVVRSALDHQHVVAIELADVDLVTRDAVKLLAQAEAEGTVLRSCPAYIREWIARERKSSSRAK
jgi:hypothetical protein